VSVPVEATLNVLRAEQEECEAFGAALGLPMDWSALVAGRPVVMVGFLNAPGDLFTAEVDFAGYPDLPPNIEFVDIATGERGTARLYPSCFHSMPCVCARYNRKAYGDRGGPHGEWRLKDWQDPTSGAAVRTTGFAMIISDLYGKIAQATGRLG
jgi:hypothetical protein